MTTQGSATWPPSVRGPWRTPALLCPQVGDVSHPDPVGPGSLEPLLQPVLGHDRGLAAVATGTAPVADLRGVPGQRRQPGDPVLRDAFALITQIVRQLAMAVDLAAVGPGLTDQLGLTHILLRTAA